jgi:hypothetical protein
MDPKYYSLIEIGFTLAVVLGFAIWQIRSVNRDIARDQRPPAPPEESSPEGARHPIGEHRLDDR